MTHFRALWPHRALQVEHYLCFAGQHRNMPRVCFMCQSPSQVGGHITSGCWDCAVVNLGHVFVNTDGYIKV